MSRVKDPRGVFTRYTVIQIQLSTEIHQLALCQWMKLQSHAFLTLPLRSLMRFIRFITLVKLAISSSLNDLCMKIKHNLFQSEWVKNSLKRVRHYLLQYKEPLFSGLWNPYGTNAKKARKTRSADASSLGSEQKALFTLGPTPLSVCAADKQKHKICRKRNSDKHAKCTANVFVVLL